MPTPGWYPDPSTPSRLRYWDGQAWTEQTAEQPPAAPVSPPTAPPGPPSSGPPSSSPPSSAPPAFAPSTGSSWVTPPPSTPYGGPSGASGYGGYGGSGGSGSSGPTGPGRGKVALLVSLVVVLVALVATGGFFGVRALTGDSDPADEASGEATDSATTDGEPTEDETTESESAEPSPEATEEPAVEPCVSGSPTERQDHPQDGDLYGGGLRMPVPGGFQGYAAESAYTFASDVASVATDLPGNYVATYALGSVGTDAFPTLQAAAQEVVLCIARSADFYPPDARLARGDTLATKIDGRDAWSATARVRIQGAEIPGGIVRVMAVETDDPESYGLFVAIMPIGDSELVAQRDRVIRALTVD